MLKYTILEIFKILFAMELDDWEQFETWFYFSMAVQLEKKYRLPCSKSTYFPIFQGIIDIFT